MKPFTHQYLVISHGGTALNTSWLLKPDWDEAVCVIDLATGMSVNRDRWYTEPNWQEVEEDCL